MVLQYNLWEVQNCKIHLPSIRSGSIGPLVALFCILIAPLSGQAQFSYAGIGLDYRSVRFSKAENDLADDTRFVVLNVDIEGMYRPRRNLGLGATLSLPVNQSSTFTFVNATTNSGKAFFGFNRYHYSDYNERYAPTRFDYSFHQSSTLTLKARYYFMAQMGFYFDVRYSFSKFTETFIYERAEREAENSSGDFWPQVEALDIKDVVAHNLYMPGFALGIQHHLSAHSYINFSGSMDIMNIKEAGFSHTISYDTASYGNEGVKTVNLSSETAGTHIAFGVQFGMGIFFKE